MSKKLGMAILAIVVLLGTMFLAPISTMSDEAFAAKAEDSQLANVESSTEVDYTEIYVYEGEEHGDVCNHDNDTAIRLYFINGDNLEPHVVHSVSACPAEVLDGINTKPELGLAFFGAGNMSDYDTWKNAVIETVKDEYDIKTFSALTSAAKVSYGPLVEGLASIGSTVRENAENAKAAVGVNADAWLNDAKLVGKELLADLTRFAIVLTILGSVVLIVWVILKAILKETLKNFREMLWYRTIMTKILLKRFAKLHKEYLIRYHKYHEEICDAKVTAERERELPAARTSEDRIAEIGEELNMQPDDDAYRVIQVIQDFLAIRAYDDARQLAKPKYLGEEGYKAWFYFVEKNKADFIELAKKPK